MRRTFIIILLLSFASACAKPEARPEPPRIGLFTGLSGPTAAWGEAIRRGAQLAADDCKSAQLLVEDDQGKPDIAANVAESFIARPGVMALIGGDTTSASMAASPSAEFNRIAMISPTASGPALTRGKHYTFRVCATDDLEAQAIARVAAERLHARRIVVLRDTRNDYSVGMAATFSKAIAPVAVFDYAAGDSDFRAQLTSAKAANPDTIFVPGYYGDVAQIATQARDLGITVPFLGGSGWDSPKLVEIGGRAVDGGWFVSGLRSESPRFVQAFRAKWGSDPDGASAQAYDATAIACAAVDRAGADRRRVRDAIAATQNFPGASGTMTIGKDGNAQKPLGVFRVVGDKFVLEGKVNPG